MRIYILLSLSIFLIGCNYESSVLKDSGQIVKYSDSNNNGINNILIFDFDVTNIGEIKCDNYEVKIYMDFENSGESWSQIYTDLEAGQTRHFTIRYDKSAKNLLSYNITVLNMDKYKYTVY